MSPTPMPNSKLPIDPRKKSVMIGEFVRLRLERFGKEVVTFVTDLANQPISLRNNMKRFALDPDRGNFEAQLDALGEYISKNGVAMFLMRARYEVSRAWRVLESQRSDKPATSTPAVMEVQINGRRIIKTSSYEGPDRRKLNQDRRTLIDRRSDEMGLLNDKRNVRDRRKRSGGRRKSDLR